MSFPVTASASRVRVLDPAQLLALVKGKIARGREGRTRAVRRGEDHAVARLGLDGPDHRFAGQPRDRRPGRVVGRRTRRVIARRIAARRQREPVTRLLGVDLGERRIGLAIADRDGGSAFALTTLNRGRDTAADAAALARVAADQAVDELVVGLPLHANGDEGAQAAVTREWVAAVAPILGLPVTFRDERLTSHLAEQRLGPDEAGPFRRAADASRSATPIAPGSIARRPRSSSRTSWTPEQRLPTGPPARPTSRRIRPGARRAQRARTTTRRPPDDDPLRRTRPRDTRQAHPWTGHVRRRVAARLSNGRLRVRQRLRQRPAATATATAGAGAASGGGHHGILRFLVFALVLAAIVLVSLVTVLRPVVRGAVVGWASDNPGALGMPFVADLVREDLGPKLTDPASTDTEQVDVHRRLRRDARRRSPQRLENEGFLADRRSFIFLAAERDLTEPAQVGHVHPAQVDDARPARDRAAEARDDASTSTSRSGRASGSSRSPPSSRRSTGLDDEPGGLLRAGRASRPRSSSPTIRGSSLPEGASLEGFLWPATYRVLPDTTAEELVRLHARRVPQAAIGDRMNVPESRGMTFYQVLTLASMVEREAIARRASSR